MAERVIKYQTQDGEQLLDPQIQGTDSQSSDQIRDTVKALRNGGASGAEAIDAARKVKISEEDVPPVEGEKDTKQADAVNVAKDIAKTLRDALKQHGDEMQGVFIKNMNTGGVTIKVTYKPDEQGQQTEDEFNFRWDNGIVSLDNGGESVDLGQIQNRSGRSFIQKDILKDKLFAFIDSHDGDKTPSDPGQIPDGTPVNEEENLWESEECQEAFCNAVTNFRNNAKDKEAIKALLKAARPYQKGNTIQEKLKEAVAWYKKSYPGKKVETGWFNWGEKPPVGDGKHQVFLEKSEEDGSDGDLYVIIKSLAEDLHDLKMYINQSENLHLGSYYRSMMEAFENLYKNYLGWDESNLQEFVDMNRENPVGDEFEERPDTRSNDELNKQWEDYSDEPVVSEEDEFGPEVGDNIDYDGGHYKLYGYCGYEVVLQNVDDERDFKLVKPADIGMEAKEQMQETDYIDPEQLPDDEDPTLNQDYIR